MNIRLFPLIVLTAVLLWAGLIFTTDRIFNLACSIATVSSFVGTDYIKAAMLEQVEGDSKEKAGFEIADGSRAPSQGSEKGFGNEKSNDNVDVKKEVKVKIPGETTGAPEKSHTDDPHGQVKTKKTENPEGISLPEELREIEKRVDISDRVRVLGIVLSRLKADDIKRLAELGKDGISGSDLEAAKEILRSRISGEEKDILKGIYEKYMN